MCSDPTVGDSKDDDPSVLTQDLGVDIETDASQIAQWLRQGSADDTKIVFTTYQSGRTIAEAAQAAGYKFDIAILGRELAEWLRGHGGGRPEGHPRFSIECKQYGSNVHVGVMRDTFGQLIDGTFLNGHIQYLGGGGAVGVNSWQLKEGSSHHSYKAEFSSCFIGIVATAAFSNGAAALSDHHQFQLYTHISLVE